MKIHHVALAVSDLQKSIDWYGTNLGFKRISDYSSKNMNIVLLEKDDSRLELFHLSDTKPLPEYHKNLLDDLAVVGTKHDSTFYGGKYVVFKDCDGILIELFEKDSVK